MSGRRRAQRASPMVPRRRVAHIGSSPYRRSADCAMTSMRAARQDSIQAPRHASGAVWTRSGRSRISRARPCWSDSAGRWVRLVPPTSARPPCGQRRLVCPRPRIRDHVQPDVWPGTIRPTPRPRRSGSNSRRYDQPSTGGSAYRRALTDADTSFCSIKPLETGPSNCSTWTTHHRACHIARSSEG